MQKQPKAQFTLKISPPFRLDYTIWVLRRREKNTIDRWDSQHYQRVLTINEKPVLVKVSQPHPNHLLIKAYTKHQIAKLETSVKKILTTMLGTNRDLTQFYKLVKQNRSLIPLADRLLGVKPTRYPSLFEALVNAISCQQITLDLGILLLNRLSNHFGVKFDGQSAFPTPVALAQVNEADLKPLGFSRQKARAIISLAKILTEDEHFFAEIENLTNEQAMAFLTQLRGIGRWSAEYVLLRGLGRLEVFPGDDVGAQKNLMLWLKLNKRPDYEKAAKLLQSCYPYAGLIYLLLLLDKLKTRYRL